MLTVRPDASTDLGHRAFHLAASSHGECVVALAPDGHGSVVDRGVRRAFSVPEKPNQIALDPLGRLLTVASDRGLLLLDTSNGAVIAREAGAFQGCHFSGTDTLWAVRAPEKQRAVLELRESRSLRINLQQWVPDPFGHSSFMLFPNPGPLAVSVWVAAGQDGQCLFWASGEAGMVSVRPFADLTGVCPPDFAFDGASMVAVVDAAEVRHYSYPEGRLLATIPWPADDGADQVPDAAFFIGPARAIVESSEGRIHIVDLRRAVVSEELVVAGHSPRPVPELYPTLANETGLGSDLAFVVPLGGGRFLSVHRHLPSATNEWNDSVLSWRVPTAEQSGSA